VKLWATPRKEGFDAGKHRGVADSLHSQVKMLPTPTQHDGMGGPGTAGRDGGKNLRTAVGGSLNPTWVEWLMGYPAEWTDLKDSATPSCRKSRLRSSKASQK